MASMARDTLLDFFADFCRQDDVFVVHDDGYRVRTLSYRELGAAATTVANQLAGDGLQAGDHLVIWSENRPEWLIALWAALLTQVVVVPVDFRASADLVARIAEIVDAKLILTGSEVGRLRTTRPQALLEDYAGWSTPAATRTRTPEPRNPGTPEPKECILARGYPCPVCASVPLSVWLPSLLQRSKWPIPPAPVSTGRRSEASRRRASVTGTPRPRPGTSPRNVAWRGRSRSRVLGTRVP
jgi:acyl-CoA synthetase (AMP-forming)/AMP-acid ligase II